MPESRLLVSLDKCSVKLGEHWALQDVSFELHSGQRWLLVGANGAGKSVLLKLLRGELWPTPTGNERRHYHHEGMASDTLADKSWITYLSPERQDKYLRYDWNLSVTQIVTTGLFDEDIPLTQPNRTQQAQVQRVLRQLKLVSLRTRRLLSLSYGQRRRVLLARALVAQPRVVLFDEVFNGLDGATRSWLLRALANRKQLPTWVLAAHSAADVPSTATHIAKLVNGRLAYAGPIEQRHLDELRRDEQGRHVQAQRQVNKLKPLATVSAKNSWLLRLHEVALFRDYRPVLQAFDWTVHSREHWAVVGANGSGKSTLLMLLYGDLHPALGGTIERAGMLPGMPISVWKKRVGYVSPELQAIQHRAGTLEEIVASGRHASVGLNQRITAADRRAAAPWLEFFGIGALRERTARQVSYGQLRLALMARAMINQPELLLLDEPFTGLDPSLHAYARAALQRLAVAGTQLIIAIHDASDRLPEMRHTLHLERGRVRISVVQ